MLGAGTAWVLLAISSRLPKPAMPAALLCNHIVDELYGEILSLPAGGSSFTWALNLTGMAKEAPERIEEKLAQVKPGCEGLVFWPFLAGTKPPGLERGVLGRLSGVQLAHGAGHVLRAVVEGLAFELNRHLDMLRCSGISIRRLVMCGGAAQSKVTTQILADVTGVAVACCPSDGGSLLGAVVLARSLLEPASSIKDLALAMLSPTNLVEPGVDASEYRKRYQSYLESLPVRKKGGAAVRPGRIAGQKGGGKEDR
jgi:xylulokinase